MSVDDILDRFLDVISKGGEKPIDPGDRTVERLPVVFVIDKSGSTHDSGDIVQINAFLKRFAEAVGTATNEDWKKIRNHLNLCVVTYGDRAEEILSWTPGESINGSLVPTLTGGGYTSMAAGLELAARAMLKCLADLRRQQIPCFRGYIFNVTDGNPTDMWPEGVPDGAAPGPLSTDEIKSKAERWQKVKNVLDGLETKSSTGAAYASTFHCASRTSNRTVLKLLAHSPERVVDLDQADFEKLFRFIRISLLMAVEDPGN